MTDKRIAVVLLDEFADWEHGLFAAAARAWLGARVDHYTPGGQVVRSMGGLNVTPEAALETLTTDQFDALAVIGSSGWEAPNAPDVGPLMRSALVAGRPVGAICGGTLAAGRAGVLRERRHTSNAADYLREHVTDYDGALYVDSPRAVIDSGLVTAPGTAPASFATGLLGLIWPDHPLIGQLTAMISAEHRAA
ncbi:DJ-1/PfpI family protein [Pleomorphomonas oryzae]|uniref:DJ-1/PfpI family protein n=1 Tax=Pleomorphomonas oryzae TaxID=261934 RepID=UPI0003F4CE4C|nr:DJ-1/PfpI family protein [Pleomorphomonas oryzae]